MRWCRSTARSARRSASTCCRAPRCRSATAATAPANTQVDASRTITVEFDANARGPWDFKPAQASIEVHPGELDDRDVRVPQPRRTARMAAQAIPSYAPQQARWRTSTSSSASASTEYTLKPGETKQWPVVFVHRPEAAEGRAARSPVVHLLRGRRQDRRPSRPRGRAPALPRRGRRHDRERRRRPARRGPAQGLARGARCARSRWSFFGVRKSSDLERDVGELNPLHVVIAGVIVAALFVVALDRAGQLGHRQRRRRLTPDTSKFGNRRRNAHVGSDARRAATPYYFVPAPSRHPAMAAFGLLLRHLRRQPVDQRRTAGAPGSLLAGFVVWALRAAAVVPRRDRRERRRPVRQRGSTSRSAGA